MVKIICPWCGEEARITYEESCMYQLKCYHCQNAMLHEDHSFDAAEKFFEHFVHLVQEDQNGRLIALPCKMDASVFTVDEVLYPCYKCEEMGRKDVDQCYMLSTRPPFLAPYDCPFVLEINEHRAKGFEIGMDNDGNLAVSLAGEWGYEGLETFTGHDGNQYYCRENAEKAKSRMEAEAAAEVDNHE